MIIDSSALVAILLGEPEAQLFADTIEAHPIRRLSAATFLEVAIVLDNRRQPKAARRLDDIIREAEIIIEAVTERQARIAREAYRDFGKGSGHPAGLNFGDCLAYALAKELREPLLFKGGDFHRTDVTPAI